MMHRLESIRPVRLAIFEHLFQRRRADERERDDIREASSREDAANARMIERPGHDRPALVGVRGRIAVVAMAVAMAGAVALSSACSSS